MNDTKTLLKTARLFDSYVRKVWPLHRVFVKGSLSRRCPRCVASENYLPLLSNGLCERCTSPQTAAPADVVPRNRADEAALGKLVKTYEGAGRGEYDALVLFSGGKDSCYMVRRLQNEFPGLRLLALTLDNTFMSPVALENIAHVMPKLGVDHLLFRVRREFMRRLFRHGITHLNDDGCYGTVDFSDGEFILDTARKTALRHGIPLIMCGYSRYQVMNGLKLNQFESPLERECVDRRHVAGLPLKDIFSSEDDLNMWWRGAQVPEKDRPRLLFPMYAWDMEEEEVKKQVADWGLLRKGYDSPLVTNHILIPLFGVVDVHRTGYSSFEVEFSRMIREGKARAADWLHVFELLEYAAKTGAFLKPSVDEGLRQLELTEADVGIVYGKKHRFDPGANRPFPRTLERW